MLQELWIIFLTQSHFDVTKIIRLNCTHNLFMNSPKKRFNKDSKKLQRISFNHSPGNDFKDFPNFYKKSAAILFSS